jgi:hypothetical protein
VRRRVAVPASTVDLSALPAEFRHPNAAVWTDRAQHLRYLLAHRWSSDVRDRFRDTCGGNLPPDRRRLRALNLWAAENGVSLPADCPDPAVESGLREGNRS